LIDAYLILNSITTTRFKNLESELNNATSEDQVERLILRNFLWQRDYASATDYSCQLSRGQQFFKYLENVDEYKSYVKDFYLDLHIEDSSEIALVVLAIVNKTGIGNPKETWNPLIDMTDVTEFIHIQFLISILLNEDIPMYRKDNKFLLLRKKMLLNLHDYKFLLLDISFLIDQLYKAQVFAFKAFIEGRGYKGNFLSCKAKTFMEDIYFRNVIEKCFPALIKRTELNGLKIKGKEICDYKLGNDNERLLDELEKKFSKNQAEKAKGIRQLINAIAYMERNVIPFDTVPNTDQLTVYPVLVYTDSTFGFAGVNKYLKNLYVKLLLAQTIRKFVVKDVIFIDLSFFEIHMNSLVKGDLSIFEVMQGYLEHIKIHKFSDTAFEVYAKEYVADKVPGSRAIQPLMSETLKNILPKQFLKKRSD